MAASNLKSRVQSLKSARLLRPPQFGLRTMLLVVAGWAVLLALGQWLPPMAIIGLGLLGVSIFLHVAGNVIGTRLRALGDRSPLEAADRNPLTIVKAQAHNFAPATHLSQHRSLGWIIVIATLAGMIVGGIGGGIWTLLASRGPVGATNVAVGVIAFATLGGMASFAVAGFTQVLTSTFWQALKSSSADSRSLTPDS